MAHTRNSQINMGGSQDDLIVIQLAEIAARLDAIFGTMKDDVEAIKARMYGTPSRCHKYEAIPIKSELPTTGKHDCLGDHIRSNLDMEVDEISLTVEEVMGDDYNCKEANDDEKDMLAEDSIMAKMKANQNNNHFKDQHETMDDVFSEKLHNLQSLNVIQLQETIEHRLAGFNRKRLEIGILSSMSSILEGEIGEEKFMLSWVSEERDAIKGHFKDQIQTGGYFEGSLSRKLSCAKRCLNDPDCTTGLVAAAHQWVSAAGYPVSELLIAWENHKQLTAQLRSRLEDKSIFRAGSIDTNPFGFKRVEGSKDNEELKEVEWSK